MKSLRILLLILVCLFLLFPAHSMQENLQAGQQAQIAPAKTFFESASITNHTLNLDGKALSYTATAGYIPLKNDTGRTLAQIFYISYTKDSQENIAQRPVTFAFNGGPGSSSIWLHMGALGPKRVVIPDDGTGMSRTYDLVDNKYTWIDFTDLVFVDPVGTGYSRAGEGVNPEQFYNLDEDVKIMGEFVRRYVTENQRWLSPKYITGESYGTTRAVSMAGHMQKHHAMSMNGLVLISSALNFETFSFNSGNDIAYVLAIPSYAAAATYHKKLSGNLQDILKESHQWAIDDFLPALAKGSTLSDSDHDKIVDMLAHYTGLSKSLLNDNRMRIADYQFTNELLSDSFLEIGLLDARVTAPRAPDTFGYAYNDPSLFIVERPFVAAFNNYVRESLKFITDKTYVFLSDKINESWTWSEGQQGYVDVSGRLTDAMSANEHLHVFAASGYYDLTTPWLSQQYTFTHLALRPSLRKNITHKYYESGHQVYTSTSSLEKLTQDVSAFFKQ